MTYLKRLDEIALLDLESALGEFDAGGWHGVKRRRALVAAARAYRDLVANGQRVDRPDNDLAHVLDAENFYLWDDLDRAMGEAANGRWSIKCDWIVERIVMLERAGAVRPGRGSVAFADDRWLLAEASVDKTAREDR